MISSFVEAFPYLNGTRLKNVLKTTRTADELNHHIESLRAKVLQIYRDLDKDEKLISVEIIRNRFLGLDHENRTLLTMFEEHYKEARSLIGKGFAEKTVQRYESTAVYLKEFMKKEYRVSDIALKDLSPQHLVCDNNGALWIRKNRQKTNNMCNIPLLSYAKKLIGECADDAECLAYDRVFPVSSNQKMNAYLQEIWHLMYR